MSFMLIILNTLFMVRDLIIINKNYSVELIKKLGPAHPVKGRAVISCNRSR